MLARHFKEVAASPYYRRRPHELEDVRTALPNLLDRLMRVDIFFHDDLHTPDHMRWGFELVWPRLQPGGVMVAEVANFGWVSFCRKHRLSEVSLTNIQRLAAVRKAPVAGGVPNGAEDRAL